jgi:heme-degrading monooxygenase HmoA
MPRWLFALIPTLALAACSSAAPAPTLEQRLDKLATCHPTDLMVVAPWIGPAFDSATGALLAPLPAGHIEVVAQGWRRRDPEATKLRTETGALVLEDALGRPGLLGFESVESDACDISISHTLWRDQASMLAFVTGEKHAAAMANAPKMHYAFAGAHWSGSMRTVPPTWEEGLQRFVMEKRAALR